MILECVVGEPARRSVQEEVKRRMEGLTNLENWGVGDVRSMGPPIGRSRLWGNK